jgi:hypothetical protein
MAGLFLIALSASAPQAIIGHPKNRRDALLYREVTQLQSTALAARALKIERLPTVLAFEQPH